jgi:uncharacterized RDD family membrane protein YckC
MPRWTQTWLQDVGTSPARAEGDYRGKRLGLPEDGRGAVAPLGVRLAAFLVDVIAAALVGRLIDPLPDLEQVDATASYAPMVTLLVVNVLGLALVGQTPGMRLFRIRVRSVAGQVTERIGFVPAVTRTLLLAVLIPALISDRDGRGLHDRLSATVVVRDDRPRDPDD